MLISEEILEGQVTVNPQKLSFLGNSSYLFGLESNSETLRARGKHFLGFNHRPRNEGIIRFVDWSIRKSFSNRPFGAQRNEFPSSSPEIFEIKPKSGYSIWVAHDLNRRGCLFDELNHTEDYYRQLNSDSRFRAEIGRISRDPGSSVSSVQKKPLEYRHSRQNASEPSQQFRVTSDYFIRQLWLDFFGGFLVGSGICALIVLVNRDCPDSPRQQIIRMTIRDVFSIP